MNRRQAAGLACAAAYVGTIYAANWALTRWGFVSVGFGLYAPAGVYFAGLALTLRDFTQRYLGRVAVIAAILLGALASYTVSPTFATASCVAFLCSEAADFAVYTPLEERSWLGAIVASNTVGLVIDSALFLWLAFGSLAFIWGQIVGKAWITALTILVVLAWKGRGAVWSGAHAREASS